MKNMSIDKETALHIAHAVFMDMSSDDEVAIMMCGRNSGLNGNPRTNCKRCEKYAACYYAALLEEIAQGRFLGMNVVDKTESNE